VTTDLKSIHQKVIAVLAQLNLHKETALAFRRSFRKEGLSWGLLELNHFFAVLDVAMKGKSICRWFYRINAQVWVNLDHSPQVA
jgi:hypothetical protein